MAVDEFHGAGSKLDNPAGLKRTGLADAGNAEHIRNHLVEARFHDETQRTTARRLSGRL